jgi:hypothetical protein
MQSENAGRDATMQKGRHGELGDRENERSAQNLPDPRKLDQLLDEELDETFPASDPLPWSHRVD